MPISRYAMNYGLILGAYWTLVSFIRIVSSRYPSVALIYIFFLFFSLYLIYRIAKSFLWARGEEEIETSRWQFILFGALLFFYAELIDGIVQFVYYQYINPLYISQQWEMCKLLLKDFYTDTQLAQLYESLNPPTPIQFVMQMVWNALICGGCIFFVLSCFMIKKQKKEE